MGAKRQVGVNRANAAKSTGSLGKQYRGATLVAMDYLIGPKRIFPVPMGSTQFLPRISTARIWKPHFKIWLKLGVDRIALRALRLGLILAVVGGRSTKRK